MSFCLMPTVLFLTGGAVWGADCAVAYWRFEAGPAGSAVAHPVGDGIFYPGVTDSTGNGNHLSAWSEGGAMGYAYRTDVGLSAVPQTQAVNIFSVKNSGAFPGLFTSSAGSAPTGKDIENIAFAQFTIEAFFKPETGGHRTIVGRDARNVAANGALAALYFQLLPGDAMAIKFADVSGYWHEAVSAAGAVQGFTYNGDPEGTLGKWYYAAAVSDGARLSLYLANMTDGGGLQLAAQTILTAGGSPNRTLAKGSVSGTNWHAGGWSVGRGLYNGNHTDRAWGFIDEVRISDAALMPEDFLFTSMVQKGVQIEPSRVTVAEEGTTFANVYVSLLFAPQGDVVIAIDESANVKQVVLDRTALTFTPANWAIPQAVRITAIDDDFLENAVHSVRLSVSVSSSDSAFDGQAVDAIDVAILDNECGAWGYSPADLNRDCRIDLADVSEFAQGWLECSLPETESCVHYNL